jgi:predicted ester cyclase
LLNGMSAVLDGYRERVVHQVAEGDLVATRLEGKGRVVGELLGVPGNGREMRSTAFSLVRFNGRGEIAEEWVEADVYGMLRQLEG